MRSDGEILGLVHSVSDVTELLGVLITSVVDTRVLIKGEDLRCELYPDDADFVVLADPDGNRFCVIDTSPG